MPRTLTKRVPRSPGIAPTQSEKSTAVAAPAHRPRAPGTRRTEEPQQRHSTRPPGHQQAPDEKRRHGKDGIGSPLRSRVAARPIAPDRRPAEPPPGRRTARAAGRGGPGGAPRREAGEAHEAVFVSAPANESRLWQWRHWAMRGGRRRGWAAGCCPCWSGAEGRGVDWAGETDEAARKRRVPLRPPAFLTTRWRRGARSFA